MAGGPFSPSGDDPFLEVKAVSRVLSSEATRGPGWDEVISFSDEVRAGQLLRSLSIPKTDQAQTHVRYSSVQHSDSKKHLIADPPGAAGSGPGSARAAKSPYKPKAGGTACNCKHGSGCWGEWQRGQWSGEEWELKRFTTTKAGMCKCVAGAAADCTAVCCCPLSLLHLLALACIKLPSVVFIRTLRKAKSNLRKKQKGQDSANDDFSPTIPFTPSLSRKESKCEVSWAPSSGFADSRMWQDYFGTECIDLASH